MLHRGMVRYRWLNGGSWTCVPELTLEELLDCQARDVARLRELGVTADAPQEHRERALELADLAMAADCLFTRLMKADKTLTRDALSETLNSRVAVLAVAAAVAQADEAVNPRWLPKRTRLSGAAMTLGAWTGVTRLLRWMRREPTSPGARSKEASTS